MGIEGVVEDETASLILDDILAVMPSASVADGGDIGDDLSYLNG